MSVFVVHGSKRKKFRTARGARWHQRRFGGRVVAGNPKKRRKSSKRRKHSRRRR